MPNKTPASDEIISSLRDQHARTLIELDKLKAKYSYLQKQADDLPGLVYLLEETLNASQDTIRSLLGAVEVVAGANKLTPRK